MSHEKIIVLDFGSQYTQLIARRVREFNVYCEILPCTAPLQVIEETAPKGIILSGGPASIYEKGAPRVDRKVFGLGIPILGICYGMQMMAFVLGGKVSRAREREYGYAKFLVMDNRHVFHGLTPEHTYQVWMSHGDRVESIPPEFSVVGRSANSPIAAMANPERKLYGLQFHPEVHHTEIGETILRNFLFEECLCRGDWNIRSFVDTSVERIRTVAGNDKVICGLSGGVDSSVTAALVAKAVGNRLTCIFVDNGLLRKRETEFVSKVFTEIVPLNLRIVDVRRTFIGRLKGVTDPEQKRKIIGEAFIEIFEKEAKKLGNVQFLAQGTLYPDVIESISFKGPSATIKSHHNVGGLPARMKLKLIEPLRELFKDEVRSVGRELGLPEELLQRQPFPGPGLGVRVLGEVTRERLKVLREADAIVHEELATDPVYPEIWQAFAVLLPVRSVGIMGDERTYDDAIALRVVSSMDGMTADWVKLSHTTLANIANRIINEVKGINRVVYDISSKPPSTIEWE